MNFTLKQKFNLALICVIFQVVTWIIGNLIPNLFFTFGDVFFSFYRIINVISILGLLPFFITVSRNRNQFFASNKTVETTKVSTSNSILLKHITTRIGSIVLIFLLAYVILLDGGSDSMGYGLIYAGIGTGCIAFLGLIIDAILIYKKEKDSSRFYTNILIISVFVLGAFQFFGMT